MQILHVTNIVSHYQVSLGREIARRIGCENYRMATTQGTDAERVGMGWQARINEPWHLDASTDGSQWQEYEHWLTKADVVLSGDRLLGAFEARNRLGRPTFYMSERWWKPPLGRARLAFPPFLSMALRFRRAASSPHFHFLAIGAYAARDMRTLATFAGRMWKWGYFPDTATPARSLDRSAGEFCVLWAGRMLHWKRLDLLLSAFAAIVPSGRPHRLVLIGDGPERQRLQGLAGGITGVEFRASCSPQEVRQAMNLAHVYALPSNAYEGWGAVVNEAMAEGCAVVGSDAAGAPRSLIQHGVNGLLFASGNHRELTTHLNALAADEPYRQRLAAAGQRTIAAEWSPAVAASRLCEAGEALRRGAPFPRYADGPLSASW